jgi:hypothetical protein
MSKLRGKKPEDRQRRLKMLLSGPAGVGKTTAAIQMPRPYIIDTEKGSVHYGDLIDKSGGAVAELTEASEVIKELRNLITEDHPYQTVVIDSATVLFNQAVEEGRIKEGEEWGRHYGYANAMFKRMCDLLRDIDMNVVVTSHEKDEYADQTGPNGKVERVKVDVGYDGYKKFDYHFDLWFGLSRKHKTMADSPRMATVMKTRLSNEFPDRDVFQFSYQELASRYGRDGIEAKVQTVELATPEQVTRLRQMLDRLKDHELRELKLVTVAGYSEEQLSDMPAKRIQKGIEMIQTHFDKNAAA